MNFQSVHNPVDFWLWHRSNELCIFWKVKHVHQNKMTNVSSISVFRGNITIQIFFTWTQLWFCDVIKEFSASYALWHVKCTQAKIMIMLLLQLSRCTVGPNTLSRLSVVCWHVIITQPPVEHSSLHCTWEEHSSKELSNLPSNAGHTRTRPFCRKHEVLSWNWLNTTNRNLFVHLSSLNGDSAICTDTQNRKGSNPSFLQLIRWREMIVGMNLLSNCMFMECTLLIFAHQACVCLWLSVSRESHNIRENWDIDVHVASKHQCSRSVSLWSNVRNTMHDTSGNGTCIIKSSFQLSLGSDCAMLCRESGQWLLTTALALGVWEEILPLQIP